MTTETTARNQQGAAGQIGGTTPQDGGTAPRTGGITPQDGGTPQSLRVPTVPAGRDRVARAMRGGGHVVLAGVAGCGAVLSYASLYEAAAPVFQELAYGFPVLVDALILGASLQYVAGARTGCGRAGWRMTAHAGIAATIALNALAAFKPDGGGLPGVPWHVTAPAVWAVLVELYARQFAGEYRATHTTVQAIPVRLWLTAPIESTRTWIRAARLAGYAKVRTDVGIHAAAREALRQGVTGRQARRVRRVLRRQLRAGSLPPAAVLAACGWTTTPAGDTGTGTSQDTSAVGGRSAPEVLRAALALVLADPITPTGVPSTEAGSIESVPSIESVSSTGFGPGAWIPATGSSAGDRSSTPDRVPADRSSTPGRVPGAIRGAHAVGSRGSGARSGQRSPRSGSASATGIRSMDGLRAAVREGIQTGALPDRPSAEAIRRHLGIAPARARILRDELTIGAVEIEASDAAPALDSVPATSAPIDLNADAAIAAGSRVGIDLDPTPVPLT